MKPFDVFLAVLVAVTWGVGFVGGRLGAEGLVSLAPVGAPSMALGNSMAPLK